jgi:hypothetical protein
VRTSFSFGRPSRELALCCVLALLLKTCFGFGRPFGQLALRSLWKPQVFSPPHLCRWLFVFCWLHALLGDSPRFWAPLWPTRLVFPLEPPSFLPTARLSLALSDLLAGRSSWRLASVLGAPLADSPCGTYGNPKFSPHRTSVACSFGFAGWALLLATRLGVGRPYGRLALRSLWNPQVFSPPHVCRRLFRICWLGAPLGDSPRFWAPLWPTRLPVPLETPSFHPTAPLSLALWVLLAGRSSWRLASVLGAPMAESPCGPSGNPKFSPHRTSVAGSLGFAGWALLLATRLRVRRPSGRLALRSLWKPQVFTPPPLCRWLFVFFCLGAPLGDSPPCSAPLWPTRLAFPQETPSFLSTTPLSPALWVLLVGRSSWRLASVFGAPLADSPCVPSGNPKFFPHRTSVAGSLGFVGWALLLATRLGVGRPSGRLALRSLWKPQVFSPPHLCRRLFGFCWLVAPLGDSPRCWAPLWPTRLAFPLETPSFLPTAPLSPSLWVLLVRRSSWRHSSFLVAPLADSPCVPSGNPKFSPHRTSVACSFGFVGWALLLPTRLGFGRPFRRLALRSLWKPQVFSPPHLFRWLFRFCRLGAPLGDSPRFWAPLWPTRLAFPLETPSFFPTAPLSLFFRFCWLGAPLGDSPRFWAPLWPTRLVFPLETPSFFPTAPLSLFFRFCLLGAPLADSSRFWAPLWPARLAFPLETPIFFPTAPLSLCFRFCWLGAPLAFSPRFWAPLWPTRLAFRLETPSFFPTAPLSLFFRFCWLGAPLGHSLRFCCRALLLATRFGFGRPFGRLALRSLWKPQVFPPPRLCRCSFDFVGWALLLPTRLGFGRPSGRLSLRSVWKPQVFSPPRHCRCSFGFVGWALLLTTRFGFGRSSSPRFWAPPWPTRLAFRLETPSFFPTATLSLFFRFCWLGAPLDHSLRFWALLFASVLGAPLADSPCVPSGNPKFFPHRDTVAVLSVLLVGRSS